MEYQVENYVFTFSISLFLASTLLHLIFMVAIYLKREHYQTPEYEYECINFTDEYLSTEALTNRG